MKKIFITGICGFVGSSLANYFKSSGYDVYGVDNFSRKGTKKNLNLLKKKKIKVYKADLSKLKNLNFFKKKNFHALIHCAALTSVLDGTNDNSTEYLYKNNILSTLNSLKLCKQLKSKFIYISSSRVYEISSLSKINYKVNKNCFCLNKTKIYGLSKRGINENFSTKNSISFYGSSKLICENIIQEYCNFNNISFIINRCGLLAGSGQFYKNDQGIISYWINSWKNKKKLSYIGFGNSGHQVRDCLHPKDLAGLITKQLKYMNNKKLKRFIFNVSGGIQSSFSLKELSLWCEKNIFPKKINTIKKNRPFDLKWIVLDNTVAKNFFKWRIKFTKIKIFEEIKKNDNK